MTNKEVKYLVLSVQTVKTSDGHEVDGVFGTIQLHADGKKKKGEKFSFQTILSENAQFEGHINRIITEALELKKKSDEQNTNDGKDIKRSKKSVSKTSTKSKANTRS